MRRHEFKKIDLSIFFDHASSSHFTDPDIIIRGFPCSSVVKMALYPVNPVILLAAAKLSFSEAGLILSKSFS
jgi:hypothetical protein